MRTLCRWTAPPTGCWACSWSAPTPSSPSCAPLIRRAPPCGRPISKCSSAFPLRLLVYRKALISLLCALERSTQPLWQECTSASAAGACCDLVRVIRGTGALLLCSRPDPPLPHCAGTSSGRRERAAFSLWRTNSTKKHEGATGIEQNPLPATVELRLAQRGVHPSVLLSQRCLWSACPSRSGTTMYRSPGVSPF